MAGGRPGGDGGVLVVGLGVAGRAAVRALVRRGVPVVATDDRPTEEHRSFTDRLGVPFVAAPGPDELRRLVADADELLPAPGLPEHHPAFSAAAEAGVAVISEFDLAARWDRRPLVAVTGTNGKTTVTTMVTAMLDASGRRAAAAGNTEIPLVEALDDHAVEVFVVEASSFRLAASRFFRPAVATWLNFAPDHLDVHRSLDAYEAAKARIWADQGPDDVAVANAEDPVVMAHLAGVASRRVTFGGAAGDWRLVGAGPGSAPAGPPAAGRPSPAARLTGPGGLDLLGVDELGRALPHDIANALAAAATATAAGARVEAVRRVLREWRPLAHRVQLVGERPDGVRFYDDSKATTPHAVRAALAGFPSVVLIAGGENKGLDLAPLAEGAGGVRAVVAIGSSAPDVVAVFAVARPGTTVVTATSMDEAVARASALARAGDAVLLSPGAASFDWYGGYGERGDDFTRAVRELLEGSP